MRREIEVGCRVTFRYSNRCCDGWEDGTNTVVLGERTDKSASPQVFGPELPLHQVLIGLTRNKTARVNGGPRKVLVVNFCRA